MFICAVISEFLCNEHRLSDVSITIYITIWFESVKGIRNVLNLNVCQLIINWCLTTFIVLHFS